MVSALETKICEEKAKKLRQRREKGWKEREGREEKVMKWRRSRGKRME
jgi:hypothetical protein